MAREKKHMFFLIVEPSLSLPRLGITRFEMHCSKTAPLGGKRQLRLPREGGTYTHQSLIKFCHFSLMQKYDNLYIFMT